MRVYGQYCGLAKALDVIGDRWTLLIVRELSIRPCRYTDLRDGLPGIATNLLADRLRTLEAAGVVTSAVAPAPVATTLYDLTDRGRELVPIVVSLARWGAPYMLSRAATDEFRPRWLVPAIAAILGDVDASDLEPLAVLLRVEGEPITVTVEDGAVRAVIGATGEPDVEITCAGDVALGMLTGLLDVTAVASSGAIELRGDRRAVARFRRLVARSGLAS